MENSPEMLFVPNPVAPAGEGVVTMIAKIILMTHLDPATGTLAEKPQEHSPPLQLLGKDV